LKAINTDGDGSGVGPSVGRQLDRELGDVPASKAVVRVDADRWLLMGECTSGEPGAGSPIGAAARTR
jgi:hypothetical protein